MQHAEKGSILDLIHKEKRLSEPRGCFIFKQILAGIEYCHSQGVAHRDIKCENILLDENYTVKLIDFGFAKCFKQVPKSSGTLLIVC
jgi:testis-specific serine kinase